MMRLIRLISSMRCSCVGSRPAVSAMTTSISRERAAAMASNTTAPGSPPDWATTATAFFSPQAASCSRAAARKVSPAASSTERPRFWKYLASLPIEVVLPEPLTPASMTTRGFLPDKSSGCSSGPSVSTSIARSSAFSCFAVCSRRARSRKPAIRNRVASTPTSLASNAASSVSNSTGSIASPPKSPESRERVFVSPSLRRAAQERCRRTFSDDGSSIGEAGGRENAFTSRDFPVYHEQVHRARLPLAMQLEADRMANLVIRPEEFAREMKVVMEERRRSYEDRPRSLLSENLLATAFAAHPYKWPTIGWMQDLENMSWRDARDWYKHWYAPNNAIVVVVGDIEPHEVLAWARRYYGALAPKAIPARKALVEPVQRGPKRVTVKAPAELPYVRLGYKAPVLRDIAKDWEPFAISLLAEVLGGSDAARLHQVLVRERRVATSVGADYEMVSRGPGMVFVEAAAAQGRSGAELEDGVRQTIARIAADGVAAEELNRAKVQLLAQLVYKRDSFFAQALELGELEASGLSFRDADRI